MPEPMLELVGVTAGVRCGIHERSTPYRIRSWYFTKNARTLAAGWRVRSRVRADTST